MQIFRVCDKALRKSYMAACHEACKDPSTVCATYLEASKHSKERNALCDSYEYVLPRPTIQNVCLDGFSVGASLGCTSGQTGLERVRSALDAAAMRTAFNSQNSTPVVNEPAEPTTESEVGEQPVAMPEEVPEPELKQAAPKHKQEDDKNSNHRPEIVAV